LDSIVSQRTTLGDHAYERIREAIISLRLEPGQMVYETELSTSLGVSRTPVREAFRRLLTEELIEILPQRGIRIAYISKQKVDEARFVRESLEMSAFRIVAHRWNKADEHYRRAEERIRSLLSDGKRHAAADDCEAFLDADEAFHRSILEEVGNATLLRVISNMRAHLNRVRYLELRKVHHFEAVIKQHAKILKAITANQEDETIRLLRDHLEYLAHDFPALISAYSNYFNE